MCSLDVTSLFANVPLDETMQIWLVRLYSFPDPPQLPRSILQNLLLFATEKSHFIFDGQYYDQIDGVVIGSDCWCSHWFTFRPHLPLWRKMVDEQQILFFTLVQICRWHLHHVWQQRQGVSFVNFAYSRHGGGRSTSTKTKVWSGRFYSWRSSVIDDRCKTTAE